MLEIEFPHQMTAARKSEPKKPLGKCLWTPLEQLTLDGEILIKLKQIQLGSLASQIYNIMPIIVAKRNGQCFLRLTTGLDHLYTNSHH